MRVNSETLKPSTEQLQKPGVDNIGKSKVDAYTDVTVQSEGHANVTLSSKAREISRFTEAAAASPELGADRVAELRQSIQNGSYKIDHKQLAADIVGQS